MIKGKGFWVWNLLDPEIVSVETVAQKAVDGGFSHLIVKIADGVARSNISAAGVDLAAALVESAHARGLQVYGYQYCYGTYPVTEAAIAKNQVKAVGVDGFVIDAEYEMKQAGKSAVTMYMNELRNSWTDIPIALSSYRFPSLHPELPWDTYVKYGVDLMMPQVYWVGAHNSADQLVRCLREYALRWPSMKVVPVGASYQENGWRAQPDEIEAFTRGVKAARLEAYNFWEYANAIRYDLFDTVARLDLDSLPDPEPVTLTNVTVKTGRLSVRTEPVVKASTLLTYVNRGQTLPLDEIITDADGNTWAKSTVYVAIKNNGAVLAELS